MESLKEFMKPEIIWFLIGIVMFALEIALPGLILGFFGLGAVLVSALCFMADISLNVQLLIFMISSVLSLLFLRRWAQKIFMGRVRDNEDMDHDIEEYVGQQVVVKEEVTPRKPGKVEFHGTLWDAVSDETLSPETIVEIIGKDSLKLKVKSVE
ncbi:MAG: NfeD family protein [Planctomycetota bacterium]